MRARTRDRERLILWKARRDKASAASTDATRARWVARRSLKAHRNASDYRVEISSIKTQLCVETLRQKL